MDYSSIHNRSICLEVEIFRHLHITIPCVQEEKLNTQYESYYCLLKSILPPSPLFLFHICLFLFSAQNKLSNFSCCKTTTGHHAAHTMMISVDFGCDKHYFAFRPYVSFFLGFVRWLRANSRCDCISEVISEVMKRLLVSRKLCKQHCN